MDRYAVIDVGTNSVKFLLAERLPGGGWRTLADRAEQTRLGESLGTSGVIGVRAVDRTGRAIAGMVEEATRDGALAIAAVGTAGLRIARNRDAVVAGIAAHTGVAVEVIPGETEACLAYLGAMAGLALDDMPVVVFDTGGGSSQFTFGHGPVIEEQFSVDVGAVRYTERFGLGGAVSPEVLREALMALSQDLARLDGRPVPECLVGLGGTVTNMAAVRFGLTAYDGGLVQGAMLDREEVDRQIGLYRTRDVDGRRAITGLQPGRADIILAGACVVRTVMEKLRRDSLVASDRGLRHGLLVDRFGG